MAKNATNQNEAKTVNNSAQDTTAPQTAMPLDKEQFAFEVAQEIGLTLPRPK